MSFLDGLKDKAEEFGEKAKDGLAAAKDKASGLVDDVKDRFDGEDTPDVHPGMPAGEAPGGISDAIASGDSPAADSGQDPYDEVLDAAQDKAEALKSGADLQADPDLQGDPDLQTDLGDHRN